MGWLRQLFCSHDFGEEVTAGGWQKVTKRYQGITDYAGTVIMLGGEAVFESFSCMKCGKKQVFCRLVRDS